jgi:putative protease
MGEFVGTVKELRRDSFTVSGLCSFSNGDGLCFLDDNGQLQGFRVNRVEGNRLFPYQIPRGIHPGLRLYRNNDQEFERLLAKPSAERKIPLRLILKATTDGFSLSAEGQEVTMQADHQQAEKPQRENIVRQLSKLGGTPFECVDVDLPSDFNYFIPSSQLASMRRQLVEQLSLITHHSPAGGVGGGASPSPLLGDGGSKFFNHHSHLSNIANRLACNFYGVEAPTAYELHQQPGALLMQCRHCLRYSLGYCVKHGGQQPSWHSPLYLRLGDGRRFRLEFDCKNCIMKIYSTQNER